MPTAIVPVIAPIMHARSNIYGMPMAETILCGEHFTNVNIETANATADRAMDAGSLGWYRPINCDLACSACGVNGYGEYPYPVDAH